MKVKTTLLLIVLALSVGCTSKKGIIDLGSEPSGAEVYVGGTKVGETPTRFYYDYRYPKRLMLMKDGYRTQSETLSELWIINEHEKGNYTETRRTIDENGGEWRKIWIVTTFRRLNKLPQVEYHTPTKSTPDYKDFSKDTYQPRTKEEQKFNCSSKVRELLRRGENVRLCITISEVENACPFPEHIIKNWKKSVRIEMAEFWKSLALEAGANEPNFKLVDRANLKAVLQEHLLSEVGLFSDETRLKVGRMLGVNYLVSIGLSRYCVVPLMRDVTTINLIDVETGRLLASDRYVMVKESATGNLLETYLNYEKIGNLPLHQTCSFFKDQSAEFRLRYLMLSKSCGGLKSSKV